MYSSVNPSFVGPSLIMFCFCCSVCHIRYLKWKEVSTGLSTHTLPIRLRVAYQQAFTGLEKTSSQLLMPDFHRTIEIGSEELSRTIPMKYTKAPESAQDMKGEVRGFMM